MKEQNEVSRQFNDIFNEYYSYEGKKNRLIEKNRKKRADDNKKDAGL